MITSYHHVDLNGVKYRLAESAEGEHYLETAEPLRPPNAQVVQGANNTFQMRPDTLAWLIDSWAGGAGQIKYDPQNPDRMYELFNVDGFIKPGSLRQGFRSSTFTFSTTASAFETPVVYPTGPGSTPTLFVSKTAGAVRQMKWEAYNTHEWGSVGSDFGSGSPTGACWWDQGSSQYLVAHGGGIHSAHDFSYTTAAWATHANATEWQGLNILGDYLYGFRNSTSPPPTVYEFLATSAPGATAPTEVWVGNVNDWIVGLAGDGNKAYFAVNRSLDTVVFELTPSTAAGAATAVRVATLPGVNATSIWFGNGLVLVGTYNGAIYYIRPGAEYGLLKEAEEADAIRMQTGPFFPSGRLVYTSIKIDANPPWDHKIIAIDPVTGAYETVAYHDGTTSDDDSASLIGAFTPTTYSAEPKQEKLWQAGDALQFYDSLGAEVGEDGYFISPWYNFQVAEKKQLMSIVVQHDMHADWDFEVYAIKDGGTTETLIGTVTGAGAPTVTTLIPSTEFEFSQIRLKGVFTGTGSATNVPHIYSIESRATVVQTQKLWQLLLDCAGDATGVHDGTSGPTKLANIRTLGGVAGPFTFKDGYKDPATGEFNTHTVVMDSFQIRQDRPGEGVAAVVLREVS